MTGTPAPGRPVRGSSTGRPIMATLDLLGRRWSLRILWELRDAPIGARALRARCDAMSSSVMYQRLAELTSAGLVAKNDDGDYVLSALGKELYPALSSLLEWSEKWAATTSFDP